MYCSGNELWSRIDVRGRGRTCGLFHVGEALFRLSYANVTMHRRGRNRTSDPPDISRVLSPLSYAPSMTSTMIRVPRAGFEPAVSWLKTRRPGPLDERGDGDDAHPRREERGRRDSNPQPPNRQSGTLPVELHPHLSPCTHHCTHRMPIAVPRAGFEPAISRLRTGCPGPLDERGDEEDEANHYCPVISRRAATGCMLVSRHFGTLHS
jgi:hypothetical protein